MGHRVVSSEAIEAERAAARWIRRVKIYLFPATDEPTAPVPRHMLAVLDEVERLHKRMKAAGVPNVAIAAEVRALLEAEGLDRILAIDDRRASTA